ncbi:MAG: alanine/glycine:cation symporter family protein [Myxococcota bacterium]
MKLLWLVLPLVWLGLLGASDARADDGTEAETSGVQRTLEAIDKAFGDYVVDNLELVMFFDILFWDNQLDTTLEAVGAEVPGSAISRDDLGTLRVVDVAKDGFTLQPFVRLESPPIDQADVRYGPIRATLRRVVQGDRSGGRARLMASVPEQAVDVTALGLEPWPEAPTEEDAAVVLVPDVAPFPIRVNRENSTVLAMSAPVSGSLDYARGMHVVAPDGAVVVVSRVTDGAVEAVGDTLTATSLPNPGDRQLPLVVAWLVLGAVFFTLRMAFVNVRMFPHALAVTGGTYDNPEDEGEISHFQALSSALSATVGLGNIAGVAVAVSAGGPGAIFWMVLAGFLGMSSKFTECTLGQMYRKTRPDGSVSGGPMHYLDEGLSEMGLGGLGKVLAVLFAILCIGGSFGGGNMFQANQSFQAVAFVLTDGGFISEASVGTVGIVYGLVLTFLVGLVIIGGIQRIGAAAGIIVPVMCVVYVLAGLFILIVHASDVPTALATIVREAFSPQAAIVGGFVGVLVQGFRRAAFSNEAGVGSASIAHSAATTAYPVREGIVALLEPFVDTIVVCTMTGLVVVVTGAYQFDAGGDGVVMTQQAFGSVVSWFPLVLSLAVILFAFSTMISWSYYGERCSIWLFGDAAKLPYRVVFLFFVFLGANLQFGNVLNFSDLMILGMAFPNILGAVLLSGKVKEALDNYVARLNAGEFERQSS